MRVVVCDTGPVLHLREADSLELLARAGEIILPPAVNRELEEAVSNWTRERPGWISIGRLSDEDIRQAEQWRTIAGLGMGEAEAIAIARSLRADWLLTDDAAARMLASLLGLEVHGSLGVIMWAAASRHLNRNEGHAALDRLAKTSLWISPRILQEAHQALQKLFE